MSCASAVLLDGLPRHIGVVRDGAGLEPYVAQHSLTPLAGHPLREAFRQRPARRADCAPRAALRGTVTSPDGRGFGFRRRDAALSCRCDNGPMVGSAFLASLALIAGAQEQERFCPQPLRPEPTRLERYMRARRAFGFRSDRAYVRMLVRRGRFDYDGWIPVTRRERRYLRLRERLTLGARANRYLDRRPHVSGGVSIEDGWPGEPYMLVRLTRDRTKHARALRRRARFPDQLRTVRVEKSYRALRRIQDRIDFDAHEPDGFHLSSTGVDIDANKVDIGLITKRADHAAYFRARYGRHVRTFVIATELTSPECAPLVDFHVSADGLTITVRYATGGGATFDRYELGEYDDRVEIGIVEQAPNGSRTDDYVEAEAAIVLSRPLGPRRVIDATTGRRARPRTGAPARSGA